MMIGRPRAWLAPVFAALVALGGWAGASAQTYPSRDITFIVPYAPGGSTDPISREFAAQLEKMLKVKVIVENKPGGSATIGTGAVIKAAPDGYTIGLGSNSSLMFHQLKKSDLPWKSADDFQPIVKLADLPTVLAVQADAPWKDFGELVAEAKKNPGKIRASVSGLRTAPDLAVQQFNKAAGIRIATVPFTGGGGEALLALLGGRVEATSGYAATMKGQVDAGKLRVIGVFQKEKYPFFPDAQPASAVGVNVGLPAIYYVIAPKGLPADVLRTLTEAGEKIVRSPEFKKFAESNGYVLDFKNAEQSRAELVEQGENFAELIRFLDAAKN